MLTRCFGVDDVDDGHSVENVHTDPKPQQDSVVSTFPKFTWDSVKDSSLPEVLHKSQTYFQSHFKDHGGILFKNVKNEKKQDIPDSMLEESDWSLLCLIPPKKKETMNSSSSKKNNNNDNDDMKKSKKKWSNKKKQSKQ